MARFRNAFVALTICISSVVGLAVAAEPASAATSRCTTTFAVITCEKNTTWVLAAGELRQVHWQTPIGTAPAGGWPTVMMFQGSLFSGELNWSAWPGLPFGAYYQTQVLQRLLDNGYAVITPEAHLAGATFWDTNNPLFAYHWSGSPDDQLMKLLFQKIDSGQFGPLNGTKMFATGISSGGYMTSRVTLAYPSRFRAVAVQSASYATCSGPLCSVPWTVPTTHAPTLLLHGGIDLVVPIGTMYSYDRALRRSSIADRVVVDPWAGHQWLRVAPNEVLSWFNRYR